MAETRTVIFLDTSYLAALAMPADALHAIAARWTEVLAGPFVTTEFVLVEMMNMLSTPPRRSKAHAVLGSIRSNAGIQIVPASEVWFRRGVALHERRSDQSWSLTDCISFEVMREMHVEEALTFDRHFEQAGFRALLRCTPPA